MADVLFPKAVICDSEVYKNFFYVGLKEVKTGKILGFERSSRAELDVPKLSAILRQRTIVTFNGNHFDLPVIYAALQARAPRRSRRSPTPSSSET